MMDYIQDESYLSFKKLILKERRLHNCHDNNSTSILERKIDYLEACVIKDFRIMNIVHYVTKTPVLSIQCKRTLFRWVNIQFSVVDEQRRQRFGPDRTCAEWILRNGGAVKFTNSEIVFDYNELPKEGKILRLQEIDGSNSSIMHNGFEHFKGCEHITKVILNRCFYLEDEGLSYLKYLKKTLLFLQISCPNITDKGLLHLNVLDNLKQLVLHDLISVKKKEQTIQALKSTLPKCKIQF